MTSLSPRRPYCCRDRCEGELIGSDPNKVGVTIWSTNFPDRRCHWSSAIPPCSCSASWVSGPQTGMSTSAGSLPAPCPFAYRCRWQATPCARSMLFSVSSSRPPPKHSAGCRFRIEHPTGALEVFLDIAPDGAVSGAGTLRTARKIMDGIVFPR